MATRSEMLSSISARWLITAAASFFTELPGKYIAALVGLGQWLWDAAVYFFNVETWAVKLGAGALVGLGQWMWNNAVDFVSGAIWAVKLGVDALTGLGTWLWNAAVSFFTNTTWMSNMLTALSGLGEWMLTAAADFFTGLAAKVQEAVSTLGGLLKETSTKSTGDNATTPNPIPSGVLYLTETGPNDKSCPICEALKTQHKNARIVYNSPSHTSYYQAAKGLITGSPDASLTSFVGTNCTTLPQYGPKATRSISGGCSCPACYTFYAAQQDPTCCECGQCYNKSGNRVTSGELGIAAMQGGGVFGAQAGGTHVLVAENGEAEAFIPEHLWGGIDPGLLASLQGYAKGGIVSPPHKLGKHPTQSQIERYNQQLGKYNQEQQLQQWDKSQLGGGGGNAYYDPSRTADQEIEYLTAVAENTGETKDQLQQQINLVNTYYPLYGKAASSTVDVKTAVEKLASDFATLPGGFKAGGATAATPGAWKDLKTGKWNYQTSDEQVAYLTQVAENTKETKAQLQKQVDQAEEYYKASGRATSKITDATTLIAAYNAKIAANTKLAAEEAQKELGDTIKNVATIVQDVVTGIVSVGDSIFNLVSTVSSLNALPVRFGGTSTVDKYPATTSTLQDKGSLEIVTALSGSTPAIGSRSVVTHLQQANTTAINTGKSLFDGLGSLAGDVVKGVSSIGSEIGSMASTTKNSDSSLTGSLSTLTSSTNGTTGAVKDGTNSIVNAISSISGASGGGIGGVFSGIMSVISGFINLITDWINMQAEQAQPTSSQFMYGGSYYQTHSTKAPVSLDPFIKDLSTIVTGAVSIATGSIGLIGSFGVGGVAWTPQFAHIAEKEPELITPLSKLGSLGFGAGRQYNITIKVQGDENNATIDRIADKVVKKIRINEFLQAGR